MDTEKAIGYQMQHFQVKIKEHSRLGRLAAWKLNVGSVAIVMGCNIHLYNVSRETFLKNHRWVKHELCHVRQFHSHGYWTFICKYVWESIRNGYYNNKFEIEAREAEVQEMSLQEADTC